jgi:hypothetical protein
MRLNNRFSHGDKLADETAITISDVHWFTFHIVDSAGIVDRGDHQFCAT